MSKIRVEHVFTSESVSEGHPDKVCDQISDAILDACLEKDPASRVACETMAGTNMVVNCGEVTCGGWDAINTEEIARKVTEGIGYDRPELEFCCDTFKYISNVHGQSPDISQGVNEGDGLYEEQGAGDQGMMFGYASNSTDALLPAPIFYSHLLLHDLAEVRKSGALDYLRPDSKSQVSVRHVEGRPVEITSVVLSHQTADVCLDLVRKDIVGFIKDTLGYTGLLNDNTEYYINPTGKFVIGGPHGDAGLTGRKIIVDTYGGVGSHGGGAFSGKDPSKVDRSAAYYSRYVAKNIVASGVADKCEVQVAYAIGVAHPLSINIDTYGTGKVADKVIEKMVANSGLFDFRPASLIKELGLLVPKGWSYQDTAAYGHFGRDIFPWESTHRVDAIRKELGL